MGESKDFVNVQKLMAGEGKWTYIKEVLGWTIDTEAVTSNRCLVVDKKRRYYLNGYWGGGCFPLGEVLGICKGVSSAGHGAVHVVAGTAGVCNFTLVLSVWNSMSTCCSCVCACCNFCARFWLDIVKFATASAWFAYACWYAAVAWSR